MAVGVAAVAGTGMRRLQPIVHCARGAALSSGPATGSLTRLATSVLPARAKEEGRRLVACEERVCLHRRQINEGHLTTACAGWKTRGMGGFHAEQKHGHVPAHSSVRRPRVSPSQYPFTPVLILSIYIYILCKNLLAAPLIYFF